MISRIVALLLLCTACSTTAWGFTSRTEQWSEDVVLHDGRLIKVEREVDWTKEFHLRDPFFGLPIAPRFVENGFNRFRIKFKHPDTQETIKWQGEEYYSPVLLDLINGVPYLVVYGMPNKDTESVYGCHELPYTYLKYDSKMWGEWKVISVDKAPDILRNANLSPHYPDFGDLGAQMEASYTSKRGGRPRRDMSLDDVQRQMSPAEQHSAGFFQRTIPRTYEEWNYLYKNNHLNERKFNDCRPPRAPLPPVVLPSPIEGLPEVLETIDYTPDRIPTRDEWKLLAFDQKREGECKKLFRPTSRDDYRQGQRFINDSTGNKPAPYSKSAQFDMGVRVLCDEYVWFVTHREDPGKIIITKFATTGDLIFRASFRNPERIQGFTGYINIPSLRSEGGYLYFDWMDFNDNNTKREWHIKRILKMRMREPVSQDVGSSK